MADRELQRRVITGLAIGVVIVSCTLGGVISSLLLILTIVAGSCIEFFRMQKPRMGNANIFVSSSLCLTPLLVILLLVFIDPWPSARHSSVFIASLAIVLILFFLTQIKTGIAMIGSRLSGFSLSLFLFTLPVFFAVGLIIQETPKLLLGLFILLWSSDVFAYFGGRAFGKHKLLASISPKKTWEGFACGLAATVLAVWGLSHIFTEITMQDWTVTAVLVVVFGVLGDLLQSAIKRGAGVKDSGTLLPGHGGMWDRFDSFLGCVAWVGMYFVLF
jgi:phosphatidate cytidylyltransferase